MHFRSKLVVALLISTLPVFTIGKKDQSKYYDSSAYSTLSIRKWLDPRVDAYIQAAFEESRKRSVPIENLFDLLAPFIHGKCLMVLTVFKQEQWQPLAFPVILRHLLPYLKLAESNMYTLFSWFQKTAHQWNQTSTPPCTTRFGCWRMSIIQFAAATKPWSCEVNVNIHPPGLLKRITPTFTTLFYPRFILYSNGVPLVPNVIIFVDESSSSRDPHYKDACALAGWTAKPSLFAWESVTNLNDVYFWGVLQNKTSNSNSQRIFSITTYTSCKQSSTIPLSKWTNSDYKFIHKTKVLNQRIRLYDYHRATNASFMSIMFRCYNPLIDGVTSTANAIARLQPIEQRKLYAHAYIVHLIAQNYSFEYDDRQICTSESGRLAIKKKTFRSDELFVSYRVEPQENKSLPIGNYAFYFNDSSNALRFITCGSRKSTTLPYEELISVFDENVWLSMMIIFVFTSIAITLISLPLKLALHGILGQLFSIMKCLLEQGDPFNISSPRFRLLKVTLVGIFTACTLLSNAYKNDNVYKMVLPRTRLKYERLTQLQNENFTYFSTVGPISFEIRDYNKFPRAWRKNGSQFGRFRPLTILWYRDEFRSEPLASLWCSDNFANQKSSKACSEFVVQSETSAIFNYYQRRGHGYYSRLARWLWDNAGVPKSLLEDTRRTLDQVTHLLPQMSSHEVSIMERILKTQFFLNEQNFLIDELGKCKNLAVILPTWKAGRFKQELISRNKPVDIGREAYTSGMLAVYLDGFVTLECMRRIWAVQEAGIINWWHHLLDPTRVLMSQQDTETVPVAAPKLSGNILLIFMLWCYGLSGCLVLFILEIWIPTCKFGFWLLRVVFRQLSKLLKIWAKTFDCRRRSSKRNYRHGKTNDSTPEALISKQQTVAKLCPETTDQN